MLVAKRCNLCGGIINADEDIYSVTLKQISGQKSTQLESVLICKFCHRDIVKTMRKISFQEPTASEPSGLEAVTVLPGIPER